MAERIVSPGVFTRERDLSFLPQGIGEIGAAIVGPTLKGPSFVPTVITSMAEFERVFGSYTTDYYTPYTVKEYLKSAGSVTVVKVGHLGGYKVDSFNLVATTYSASLGAEGDAHADSNLYWGPEVVATFLPGKGNNSGEGSISGSFITAATSLGKGGISGSNFSLNLAGANATASVVGLSILEDVVSSGTDANFIANKIPDGPAGKIGSTDAPAYLYKHFRSSISASYAAGRLSSKGALQGSLASAGGTALGTTGTGSVDPGLYTILHIENHTNGADFASGAESVNGTTYVSTITGNTDAAPARTPYIQSQSPEVELFRIYMRSSGGDGNANYAVIRDVKKPQNSNSSPEYAQFGIELYDLDTNLLESWGALNLDPTSPNYIVKSIGDQFESVDSEGAITVYGDYPNKSKYIRIGDFDEDTFTGNKALQPMGHAKVIDPVKSTASVPSASFNISQAQSKDRDTYKVEVPYGWKIGAHFFDSETWTQKEYQSPIPKSEGVGSNVTMSLENMYGWGAAGSSQDTSITNFVTSGHNLTISASAGQLKFAVPFQYGFNGVNPSKPVYTGNAITATNTMGFDCSASTTSGSLAYKRAIGAVSNPDEIDINMLVTPGIIHKLHPAVTNLAIDKVEARADAFYVMDTSAYSDNVSTAISNIATLDTNYVATYYPWVKIDDPSTGQPVWVPPSVVIPGVIAFTDRVAHEWFAPAGLNRGGLSSVRMAKKKLTHTERDQLYDARINPIASFPGQGVVVFGQKTLQAKPSALDRINVRRLLIRLKKFISSSSRYLVFEQNDSSTRARFLNIVNPFLESVQSNSGLSAFKVVMDDSNNTPDVIDRNQLVGQIFIQPTRTAEFIVLDFSVLPTGAAFPE